LRRPVAAWLAASAVLTGCATNGANDPLQVTDKLLAAAPASSPPTARPPAGTIRPAPAASLVAYDTATHTLALASGSTLNLFNTRAPNEAPRTLALPGTPAGLRTAGAGTLLASLPESQLVARVDLRTGAIHPTPVHGGPVDAADTGDQLAVALRDTKSVAFLQNATINRTADGFDGPAQLFAIGPDVLVLDRLATSVTPVDPRTAGKQAALRAGNGATNAVADRFGRILVTDTRDGELLAFSADPLIMKQRYPVSGAPYGIAYDPARDLAWITLTETNELVGYNVKGGQPEQRYRLPTVRQPNAVAVDPESGDVFVASATGDGIQVVTV
jgi:hypothetical protein